MPPPGLARARSRGLGREVPAGRATNCQAMPHRLARAAAHRLAALRRNTLALVFWLLVATIASGLASIVAFVLVPAPSPSALRPGTVYDTPGFALDLSPLRLHAGEGLWIPILHGERLAGVLVLAEGSYRFAPEGREARRLADETGLTALEDRFTAVFLTARPGELPALRQRAGAAPVGDPGRLAGAQQQVSAFLQEQAALLRDLPLGLGSQGVLHPSSRWLLIAGRDYGRVRVTFGRELSIEFADLDRRVLTFRNPAAGSAASPLFPRPPRPALVLVFVSTALILMMLVLVLTADLERPAGPRAVPPATHWEARLAGALLALEAVLLYVADALPAAAADPALVYALLAGLVLTRPAPPRFRFAGVGLSRLHLLRGLAVGTVVGALGYFAAHLSLPAGLRDARPEAVALQAARAVLLAGLALEVYRRGLVQTALERRLGRRTGLVAASFLFGAVYALPNLLAAPSAWPDWLLYGLVVVPLTEALFGYMYDRTGTVVAGATARGMLELLNRLLV